MLNYHEKSELSNVIFALRNNYTKLTDIASLLRTKPNNSRLGEMISDNADSINDGINDVEQLINDN